MDDPLDISGLAHELSDLELALLICLGGHEHCLIEATGDNINDVAAELALICSHTYSLWYTLVELSETTTFEEFREQICTYSRNETSMADVIIAKNLDYASDSIQREALELMRSRKLTTENGVIEAPAHFLFVPVIVRGSGQVLPKLNAHLNDNIFISHFHDTEDGYAYLEEDDWNSEQASLSSVVHKTGQERRHANISPGVNVTPYTLEPGSPNKLLETLHATYQTIKPTAELIRYQQDIVVFLRLSRAVAGGISARSNVHFTKLAKLFAVIHGIDYITPSIVALAAKKVFRHRIAVARPEDDRSLQYGSDLEAVAKVLEYATPDTILESVLMLEAPL